MRSRSLTLARTRRPLLLLATLCLAATVQAASDGAAGASSTGQLRISLVEGPSVRISGLTDIAIDAQSPQGSSPACVYARGGHPYQLRISGSGRQQAFELASGAQQLSYQVQWEDGERRHQAQPGQLLTGLTGANPRSGTCDNAGSNGQIWVAVPALSSGRGETPTGTYTGTLTLTIAPD